MTRLSHRTGIAFAILVWLIPLAVSVAEQQVLFVPTAKKFSVGFSLQSSYGAAAVILEDENGNLETKTNIHYGGEAYEELMARLSLASSRHLAPPYEDMSDYFNDQPRRAVRDGLKKVGLPASRDVGTLASVLDVLKSELEMKYGIKVSEAVFTSSHLLALYQDDLMDMADHLKVKYVTPKRQFKPILWETAASYAGYGLGLCEHWQDTELCTKESNALPNINVLAVHYSRTALTVSLVPIQSAVGAFEPDQYHLENFTLGADAAGNYPTSEEYWSGVEYMLLHTMREYPGLPFPKKIMLTGDKADDEAFVSFLKKTMENHIGSVPSILSDKALTAAAEGTAELMRRGPAPWS